MSKGKEHAVSSLAQLKALTGNGEASKSTLNSYQALSLLHWSLLDEKERLMPYRDFPEVAEETRDLTAQIHAIRAQMDAQTGDRRR